MALTNVAFDVETRGSPSLPHLSPAAFASTRVQR